MLAVDVFPEMKDQLLDAALKIGDHIWKDGLLKKGNGLCHGVTGNAYMLHSLYRSLDLLGLTDEKCRKMA
jgi:hypothetical protein